MNYVSDLNVLYDAFKASMKSSSWKRDPQRFERDFLSEIVKLHDEIEDRTYKTSESHVFITHERGKARLIHGGRMRDRVMRHALCDSVLNPTFDRYIYMTTAQARRAKASTLRGNVLRETFIIIGLSIGQTKVGYVL